MYIGEIYALMDDVFDKIFENYIVDDELKIIKFELLCKEKFLKKKQQKLNELLIELFKMTDEEKIKSIVKKDSNVVLIKSILSKFIYYYLFLFIGVFYEFKLTDFNNNLIEMCKEQVNYDISMGNLFTAETTSILIKSLSLINEMYNYLTKKHKLNDVIPDAVINFISAYGNADELEKYINENKKNVKVQYHALIKLIISVNIFNDSEKKYVFDEIESNELSISEYMFIDVVMPKRDYIDIMDIENILSPEDIENGYAYIIYDMINSDEYEEIEKIKSYAYQYDIKIIKLFEYKICVPIVDDFLLYHKDFYKYEKKNEDKIDYVKKKDDTKIKYIVNKINIVKDYYKNVELAKSLFYKPLIDKNAVLVNADEMYKIRTSLANIIKFDNLYADYIQDLEEYDEYPYISFKDYNEGYFVLSTINTIDALRSINFKNDNTINFKTLQTRVITNNMYVNVVGFVISDNVEDYGSQLLTKYKNVNEDVLNDIKKMINNKIKKILSTSDKSKNHYYYFDKSFEKLYAHSSIDDKHEKVKVFLSSMFDYAMNIMFDVIKKLLKPINFMDNYELFLQYCRKYDELKNKTYEKNYNELIYYIFYENCKNIENLEDPNELIIHGIGKNVIKLGKISEEIINKQSIPIFDLSYKKKVNNVVESNKKISSNMVCQHIVTWDKINKMNSNELYGFLYKYGYKNKYKMYVCKSCGYTLDIKKYEFEQSFETKFQTHEFFELTYNGNLEDLQEYSKYDLTIKSIKKYIERMGGIFGIKDLSKGGYNTYIKTKIMLKNIIDLLIYQEKEYKENNYLTFRKTNNVKMGVSNDPNYNDFFVFELSNSIFVQSSKDKLDYMKIQKFNNVICYILLIVCMDMTDNAILALKMDDKICSFNNFNSVKNSVFKNLKIYVNLEFDAEPILNYPILCFILYIFSCFVLRYNVWGNKFNDKSTFAKYQLTIIHTTVEIMNNIVTIDYKKYLDKNIFLYDTLNRKYFKKLQMFKNNALLLQLIDKNSEKEEKKMNIRIDNPDKDIEHSMFAENDYRENLQYYEITYKKLLKKVYDDLTPKPVSNIVLSNAIICKENVSHIFEYKNNKITCKKCGFDCNDKKTMDSKYEDILINDRLIKMSKKYCIDGKFHKFIDNMCILCKFDDNKILNKDEMNKMYENVLLMKEKNEEIAEKIIKDIQVSENDELIIIKDVIEKCIYKFKKYGSDINQIIDILLDNIQKIMGKELYISDEKHNLFDDIYILTNDLDGKEMENPEIILNNNQIVKEVINHSIYKTNVISITLIRNNTKYDAVFDSNSLYLLGYRKQGKDFIDAKADMGCKLKINYSLKNMLLYFGFSRINMSKKDYENSENIEMSDFTNRMCSYRFYCVRQLGHLLNKYIARYSNRYVAKLNETVDMYKEDAVKQYRLYNNDALDLIYKNIMISSIKVDEYKNDKLHLFLKYFNDLYKYLPYNTINEQILNSDMINPDFVLKHDYSSNILINYIYDEIIRLIKYNKDDIMSLKNMLTFIIAFITKLFNRFNLTKSLNDTDAYIYKKLLSKTPFFMEYTQSLTKHIEEERALSLKTMSSDDIIKDEDVEKILNVVEQDDDNENELDIDDEDKGNDSNDDDFGGEDE